MKIELFRIDTGKVVTSRTVTPETKKEQWRELTVLYETELLEREMEMRVVDEDESKQAQY